MATWAYEMSNDELLNEFCRSYAKAAVSNSGLVIDCFGGCEADMANYLKGVLRARLDGVKPPFKRGDVVVPVANYSVGWQGGQKIFDDPAQSIYRIYYEGSGSWLLVFHGAEFGNYGYPKYAAAKFKLKEVVKEVIATMAANG